jgi:hypothetical protein
VRTSCLGFGDGYNEDLLNELSKAAGGALHDADSPEKFPAIFQQELDSLLTLSAQNVRVLPVQSEADVKVDETAIKWVAEQIAGRAISDAIAARDQGDANELNRRIDSTKSAHPKGIHVFRAGKRPDGSRIDS